MLQGNILPSDLNQGIRPGDSKVYGSSNGRSTDSDTTSQDNESMNTFRKRTRGTQEYNISSEYSNTTSEYGLYPSCSSTEIQTARDMERGSIKRTSQGVGHSGEKL